MSYNPMNPWGDALKDVTFLRTFNANSVYPATGARFEKDSAEYKQNAAATFKASTAFNAAVKDAGLTAPYPISYAGQFWEGTNEIAVHKDDAPRVLKVLGELQAQGLIDRIEEIPKEQSWTYAMTKAKFTPH